MRLRGLLFATVAALLVVGPTAGAAASSGASIVLFAHWPSDYATATEEPIPLNTLGPVGEPDLSSGPAEPGASAAGTMPIFTYVLVNPDGSRGPVGDVDLDPSRPVLLDVYLSADQTPWPAAAGEPPHDADYGVAPRVTVEATLRIGGEAVSTATQTHDLVSTPEQVENPVQPYLLELPFEQAVLERGEGLAVEFTVRQADVQGEEAMQPLWNVHTGQEYPTGIELPFKPGDDPQQGVETLADGQAQTQETRTAAVGVLAGSMIVATVAGARMIRER